MERMVFSRVYMTVQWHYQDKDVLDFMLQLLDKKLHRHKSLCSRKTGLDLSGYRDIPQLIMHSLPIYKAFLWSRGHVEGNHYDEDLHVIPTNYYWCTIYPSNG